MARKILKILFILGFPNPFPGAAWTRIDFLAETWSRSGHPVSVLGTFGFKTFQRRGKVKIGNVSVFNYVLHMDLSHPVIFTMNSVFSFVTSTLFLLLKKPNVAVVSVPSGDVGLGALMACRLLKVKNVIDYRDEWEDYVLSIIDHKAGKTFYSLVKKLATSFYMKSQLRVALTLNHVEALERRGLTNVKLMPNGADMRTFKPLDNRNDSQRFTIFFSGSIGGYYDLIVVAKSIKKLVDGGLRCLQFRIAGCGEARHMLNLAQELGIANNIKYLGVINDRARLAKEIAGADVGLVPYDDNPLWKNSLPAKFFEYCACGIPTVATAYKDSTLARLVRKHEIGVIVPPRDEDKLAEAIQWIYYNESFRKSAGKRARTLVEREFDRNKIAQEFINLLKILF